MFMTDRKFFYLEMSVLTILCDYLGIYSIYMYMYMSVLH